MFRRPIPADLLISDLDDRERLNILCPGCGRMIGYQAYDIRLRLPADLPVARFVARHVCVRCGVRARGEVEDWPRSGAERG